MDTCGRLSEAIRSGAFDRTFAALYPAQDAAACGKRYLDLIEGFVNEYGGGERRAALISAPGRTEVCGNHTDHQHGNVLAAAVDLDTLCVAAENGTRLIRVRSVGYPDVIVVSLDELGARAEERGVSSALVRGVAAWFTEHGAALGGFDALTTSNVLGGSGLSSSAAFEVAIGTILNTLFGAGKSPLEVAIAGQFAENNYFGKPCGLMDQTASSVGGFVRIDFADPQDPVVEPIAFDLAAHGLGLCVVNTKGSHAELTGEYAAITDEMRRVAEFFGKQYLRDVPESAFYDRLADVRAALSGVCGVAEIGKGAGAHTSATGAAAGTTTGTAADTATDADSGIATGGDRAVLRALHFFRENSLVLETASALRAGDRERFLENIIRSGLSSFTCLQNVFAASRPDEQGLSLALALSESTLRGKGGAWRVHGGGFAGTIQAFVPEPMLAEYRRTLEAAFGQGACLALSIRPFGGTEVLADTQKMGKKEGLPNGGTAL
ncbi:MAG: galactokinase [Clostridiales bacterium]|jgi:galactokinase|nr:galactokinase [Clostridiales bacterium]